jgi:putative flippase GtrA
VSSDVNGTRAALARVLRRLWREMVGFGLVGTVGVTCDFAAFNFVLLVLHGPHVLASVSGTVLGTIVSYIGNKFWVFRKRDQRQSAAELLLFVLVSGIAIGLTALCVYFNDTVLGNHSALSANIAQFIFGQGLGTVFRFWGCHRWVFPEPVIAPASESQPGTPAEPQIGAQSGPDSESELTTIL